jgi:hypothetical protein
MTLLDRSREGQGEQRSPWRGARTLLSTAALSLSSCQLRQWLLPSTMPLPTQMLRLFLLVFHLSYDDACPGLLLAGRGLDGLGLPALFLCSPRVSVAKSRHGGG